MKLTKTKHIHNTALLFILIAPFAIVFYAMYVFNPTNAGNISLYLLQVIADAIAIITLGTLWITILLDLIQPEYHKRELKYDKSWLEKYAPTVDILVPVANEPHEIILNTIQSAMQIDYPHKVYLLDDGDSPEVKKIAQALRVEYVARPKHARSYAKAGNLNYGLRYCTGEFFAVFDADHAPKKEFLTELLPFFQTKKVALVQSPQHYINTKNFIAQGSAESQEIFYKYVQPSKNSYNASFCVGTNMIFRRTAIQEIGGIALLEHSEDIWTTILLHEKGYESVFYNKVLASGRAPETIPSYFRQQNRWARGGFSLFFSHNPMFISSLTTDQKLQYIFSNIHYFSAFAILIYLLLPIIFLLTGQHPMDIYHGNEWLIHYLPYFVTVYFLPVFLLGSLKLSTISTSIARFYPYLRAFLSELFKNKYKWISTESSSKRNSVIMLDIWPHVFIIALSLFSVLVGWYNPTNFMTTLITTFWVLLNAYFLFVFIKNGITQGE